ncbi:DUF4238 domain-containing protein [Carnobacterium mobile]|uniref:DUF4238 domain-containing protein n=1 Tax=Carnobacterium mobile TaxID=2750 RepID=UPI00186705EA|nr:DUF4238 domain-containing protein [Carnobacterium mobile]
MKINNHYVPKTYLKQWAIEKRIYEYNLLVSHNKCPKWNNVSISRTSSLDSLYLYYDEGEITDEMEDFFSIEFEMQFSSFINKINSYSILDVNDKEYISKLVASQYLRTLKGFYRIQKIVIDTFPDIIKDLVFSMEQELKTPRTLRVDNKSKSEYDNFIPLKVDIQELDEKKTGLNVQTIAGKSLWLFGIKHLLTSTYKTLNKITWCVYDAPNNFEWATSDDPVIFLNYYNKNNYNFDGGWGVDNTNIIFPLSPTKLLFATIGHSTPLYQKATVTFAEEIQRYIVENAYSKVYSRVAVQRITKMRKRHVDEEEFKKFNNSLKNFHDNYMNNELPLLKGKL